MQSERCLPCIFFWRKQWTMLSGKDIAITFTRLVLRVSLLRSEYWKVNVHNVIWLATESGCSLCPKGCIHPDICLSLQQLPFAYCEFALLHLTFNRHYQMLRFLKHSSSWLAGRIANNSGVQATITWTLEFLTSFRRASSVDTWQIKAVKPFLELLIEFSAPEVISGKLYCRPIEKLIVDGNDFALKDQNFVQAILDLSTPSGFGADNDLNFEISAKLEKLQLTDSKIRSWIAIVEKTMSENCCQIPHHLQASQASNVYAGWSFFERYGSHLVGAAIWCKRHRASANLVSGSQWWQLQKDCFRDPLNRVHRQRAAGCRELEFCIC